MGSVVIRRHHRRGAVAEEAAVGRALSAIGVAVGGVGIEPSCIGSTEPRPEATPRWKNAGPSGRKASAWPTVTGSAVTSTAIGGATVAVAREATLAIAKRRETGKVTTGNGGSSLGIVESFPFHVEPAPAVAVVCHLVRRVSRAVRPTQHSSRSGDSHW